MPPGRSSRKESRTRGGLGIDGRALLAYMHVLGFRGESQEWYLFYPFGQG